MGKALTQRDLADRCGVSVQVISAALNGRRSQHCWYSDETREKVLGEARRSGYRVNRAARSLVRQRHGAIGIVGNHFYAIPQHLLLEFFKAARRRDLVVIMDHYADPADPPICLRQDMVDAVVLFEDIMDVYRARMGAGHPRRDVPCMLVNADSPLARHCILYDEDMAMGLALDHLHARGCRSPALLYTLTPEEHYSTRERLAALDRHAARLGMARPSSLHWLRESAKNVSVSAIRAFLAANPGIDALVATEERIAAHALELHPAMRGDHAGIKLIGFLTDNFAKENSLPSLQFDGPKLANRILDRLGDAMAGKPFVERFPYHLVKA